MGKRYEGYKEGFKEGFREGLKEKTGKEIGAELREELEAEVRKELREELVDEVKEELKAELREEVEEGYLREFIEDFKKRFVEGFREEFPKGVQEGRQETLRRLAADGVLTTAQAAKLAGTTEAEFCEKFGLSPEPSNGAASDGASGVDESRAPGEDASDGKDADEDEILICSNTLREEGDLFLDDVSLGEVRAALKPKLTVVPNTGADLFRALLGNHET